MPDDLDLLCKAMTLLQSVEEALARGTKHWDMQGRPLDTVADIINAMSRDGRIQYQPPTQH